MHIGVMSPDRLQRFHQTYLCLCSNIISFSVTRQKKPLYVTSRRHIDVLLFCNFLITCDTCCYLLIYFLSVSVDDQCNLSLYVSHQSQMRRIQVTCWTKKNTHTKSETFLDPSPTDQLIPLWQCQIPTLNYGPS